MNQLTSFLMMFILLLSPTACGQTQAESASVSAEANTSETTKIGESKETAEIKDEILVAYFSATGTTRLLAEYAADILDADLYEIVPEEPYTEEDLAYYTNGRADREQNNSNARPAISGNVKDMAAYDVVFIGYPIWHGQAPRIISTFLESYDFSGKPLCRFVRRIVAVSVLAIQTSTL